MDIGLHFGIGESGVSQACRRLAHKIEKDKKLKNKIERLEKIINLSRMKTWPLCLLTHYKPLEDSNPQFNEMMAVMAVMGEFIVDTGNGVTLNGFEFHGDKGWQRERT